MPISTARPRARTAKGAQTLTVRAVDSAGNVGQASVNVTVK